MHSAHRNVLGHFSARSSARSAGGGGREGPARVGGLRMHAQDPTQGPFLGGKAQHAARAAGAAACNAGAPPQAGRQAGVQTRVHTCARGGLPDHAVGPLPDVGQVGVARPHVEGLPAHHLRSARRGGTAARRCPRHRRHVADCEGRKGGGREEAETGLGEAPPSAAPQAPARGRGRESRRRRQPSSPQPPAALRGERGGARLLAPGGGAWARLVDGRPCGRRGGGRGPACQRPGSPARSRGGGAEGKGAGPPAGDCGSFRAAAAAGGRSRDCCRSGCAGWTTSA